MQILVAALREDREFDLRLTLVAGEQGLHRTLESPQIQKSGLALAGFLDAVQPHRIEVFGETEIRYLATLGDEQRSAALAALLRLPIGCVVVTDDEEPPPTLLTHAEAAAVAVFRTPWPTGRFITLVQDFLDENLSPETTIHAVMVDVFGVGVLLTGTSGIGKSECALDLILRGHRLVADDVVRLRTRHRRLFGLGSPLTRNHMEVRGLGIINVLDLFGAASVRERKVVELVVELFEGAAEADRTGLDDLYEEYLDMRVAKIRLPVRPGRNLAAIVEVAARNHLLRQQGHHAARELQDRLERQLASGAPPGLPRGPR